MGINYSKKFYLSCPASDHLYIVWLKNFFIMNEIIDNVLVDNFFDNSQFNESLNFEDTFSRINVNLYDEYDLGDGSIVNSQRCPSK